MLIWDFWNQWMSAANTNLVPWNRKKSVECIYVNFRDRHKLTDERKLSLKCNDILLWPKNWNIFRHITDMVKDILTNIALNLNWNSAHSKVLCCTVSKYIQRIHYPTITSKNIKITNDYNTNMKVFCKIIPVYHNDQVTKIIAYSY